MKTRKIDSAEIDMTPMLDIVFIMLIFFIVSAVFLDEKAIAMAPPPPDIQTTAPPKPAIAVYMDSQGRVSVDGERTDIAAAADRVVKIVGERGEAPVLFSVSEAAFLDGAVTVFDDLKTRGIPVSIRVVEAEL